MDRNKRYGLVLFVACLGLLQTIACQKTNDQGPELSISNVSLARNTTGSNMIFHIILSKPASKAVSVDYSTADGTAITTTDYESVSGTATIAQNETQAAIEVKIIGDPP